MSRDVDHSADRQDLRHVLPDDPDASESIALNVLMPERELFVIGYLTVDAAGNSKRLAIQIPTDGGQPYIDGAADMLASDQDFDDFSVASMAVTQPDDMTMTARFDGDRIGLDYRFDGMHELFTFDKNADGVAPGIATNRFEQAGLIAGTVRIDDQSCAFRTTGHRDHSWGPRDYGAVLHWKWISAQAGPDIALHAMHTWVQGKQFTNGYVWRGGELAPIVELCTSIDYDDRAVQRRAAITAVDAMGRVTKAEAERFAHAPVHFPTTVMVEAGCRFEIAGRPGVGVFEIGWQPDYFAHLRDRRHAPRI